jgi:hypothetical protein
MKFRMNLGGRVLEVEKVDFKALEETWSLYRLLDGTTLKIKPVVAEIYKLPDPDPVTGLPQFMVKSSNILSVEPPEPPLSKREMQ